MTIPIIVDTTYGELSNTQVSDENSTDSVYLFDENNPDLKNVYSKVITYKENNCYYMIVSINSDSISFSRKIELNQIMYVKNKQNNYYYTQINSTILNDNIKNGTDDE